MSILPDPPTEILFTGGAWLPQVTVRGGRLHLDIVGGADALHDPREFTIPCEQRHLDAVRESPARLVLLQSAFAPLCERAGIRGPLPDQAAKSLLDPILCRPEAEVNAFMARTKHSTDVLIAYGANLDHLRNHRFVKALQHVREHPDWKRVDAERAQRQRAEQGVVLGRLDTAVLQFTGRLVHGTTLPRRDLQAVKPAQRAKVLQVIEVAEQASSSMRVRKDPPIVAADERPPSWDDQRAIREKVSASLLRAYPHLAQDAVDAVAALMALEARQRSQA